MKVLASILSAAAFMIVLAAPALAQGGTTQQGDTVTKTFKLTVYGDVDAPAERAFAVSYGTEGAQGGTVVQLCGPKHVGSLPVSRRVTEGPCEGNGTVYSFDLQFPRGTKLAFAFDTMLVSDESSVNFFFASFDGMMPNGPDDFETLNSDMTNSAWYRFGSTNQQTPSQMPATGAGGASGSSLPVGALYLALPVVLAAGYALRRQWQAR